MQALESINISDEYFEVLFDEAYKKHTNVLEDVYPTQAKQDTNEIPNYTYEGKCELLFANKSLLNTDNVPAVYVAFPLNVAVVGMHINHVASAQQQGNDAGEQCIASSIFTFHFYVSS